MYIKIGQLTFIHTMNMHINKNGSEATLMLHWNEPFLDNVATVLDYYQVSVNEMNVTTSSPMTEVALSFPNDTEVSVRVRALNCFGFTLITSFTMNLLEGNQLHGYRNSLFFPRCHENF